MNIKWVVTFLFVGASLFKIYALKVGSDTAVSVAGHTTFPAADFPNNEMIGFAAFASGFTLEDSLTTVSFNSVFPVSRDLNINGGTVVFASNRRFLLDGGADLHTSGSFIGQDRSFEFSESVSYIGPDYSFTIDNLSLQLRENLKLDTDLHVNGDCEIDTRGHILKIRSNGSVTVRPNSSLLIRNSEINGISGTNFNCFDDSGSMRFDNVSSFLSGDWTFSTGSMAFAGKVEFQGSYRLIYSTTKASTIDSGGILTIGHSSTFSYVPENNSQDLLYFTDNSSRLILDEATVHVGFGGLVFKGGRMVIVNSCTFTNDGTQVSEGIYLGDGTEEGTIEITLARGSLLNVNSGYLTFDMT